MNKIHITGILLALSTLWACNNKNPMDEEQYFKQIYLVGAYDHVFTQTVYYNDTEAQETFISVAASGSLGLDEDVNVTVGIFPEEVPIYNEKYIGHYSSLPYYSVLPEGVYDIPSLQVTLRADGEVYEQIPIYLDTKQIHCDSNYAIPFRITSVSAYQTTTDSVLLLALDMQNEYSATYAMSGSFHLLDETGHELDTTLTGKNKELIAVSQYELRMFYYDASEEDENITSDCLVLTINPEDNSVSIRPWNTEEFQYPTITQAGGTYTPATQVLDIWYEYTDNDTGQNYRIREALTRQ